MEPVFHVAPGAGAYKIMDDYGTVFGSYQSQDDADHYCEVLNEKWADKEVRS